MDNETSYLLRRKPSSARGFSRLVKRARETLATFGEAGNATHGLQVAGGLTLVIGDDLFDYTREDDIVNIIAIRHGRMSQAKPDLDDGNDLDPDIKTSPVGPAPKRG